MRTTWLLAVTLLAINGAALAAVFLGAPASDKGSDKPDPYVDRVFE
jgi:hypothetical protein